jgi:aminoglycoside N3'-acetyltransferase
MTDTLNTQSASNIDALVEQLSPVFSKGPESVYWVSIDFRTMLRATKTHHTDAEAFANYFLQSVVKAIGDKATLLISAFNVDFPHTKVFDVEKTPVQTGSFGGLLVKQHAKNRIVHPFYSFLAFGAGAQDLLSTRFPNSTGKKSILGWVVDQNTELVTIGHHYVKALSSVHHAEDIAGISYRYHKSFSGDLVRFDEVTEATCSFYVRELETCDFSSLTLAGDSYFREKRIVQTSVIGKAPNSIVVHNLDLGAAHEVLVANLQHDEVKFVDYLGPKHEDQGVITGKVADKLFSQELAALKA